MKIAARLVEKVAATRGLRRTAACGGALVLSLALMAGCGNDDEGAGSQETTSPTPTVAATPTPTPTGTSTDQPEGPACDEVWVDGQKLPRPYRGCVDSDGAWVKTEVQHCSTGQRVVTFDNSFYAVVGRRIIGTSGPLSDDPDYSQLLAACTA